MRRIEDLLYKPRHSSERTREGRRLVVVRGRTFERLTFVRAGLVILGLTIAGLAWLLPNPDKPAQGSSPRPTSAGLTGPRQTGIVTTPASHRGAGAMQGVTSSSQPVTASAPSNPGAGRGGARPINANSPLLASSPARNLPTPAGLGPALREAWVLADPGGSGLGAVDVASTAPGSVYFASQPAIPTYWAIARFVPTAAVHGMLLAQFSVVAAFEKAAGGSWSFVGESKGPCSAPVPAPVLRTWDLCQSPGS